MSGTTIYSYPKAWKIDNKLYSFYNLRFSIPLDLRQLLYFAVVLIGMLLLSRLSAVARIPWIIRFAVIPYAAGNFLLKKKLDGKTPIFYFIGWVGYLARRGQYMERFTFHPVRQPKEHFHWYCVKGGEAYL
jgi:hypothetical protein